MPKATTRQHELHYLPLPERGRLTAREAQHWVARRAPEWLTALGVGFRLDDATTRADFELLASDVRTMLEACVAASTTGRAAGFSRSSSPDTEGLARIVASQRRAFDGLTGAAEECFEQLAHELAARLASEAA